MTEWVSEWVSDKTSYIEASLLKIDMRSQHGSLSRYIWDHKPEELKSLNMESNEKEKDQGGGIVETAVGNFKIRLHRFQLLKI